MRSPALLVVPVSLALLVAGCQSTPSTPSTPTPTAQAAPPPPPPPSPTFQPGPGIVCERKSEVCSYRKTPSPALTRFYFSNGAAERLLQPPAADPTTGVAPPARKLVDPIFKPSPPQSCDTLVLTCYDMQGANVELTRAHFGDKVANLLQARLDRPKPGANVDRFGETITCDNLSKVCYDRLGAGYGITRLYLGEPQATRLLERLQASPQS